MKEQKATKATKATEGSQGKNARNFIMVTLPDASVHRIKELARSEERSMSYICRRMIHASPEMQGGNNG